MAAEEKPEGTGFFIGRLYVPVPVLLAPMAAVTDLPFRTVCEEQGVGLTITEFLSANALSHGAQKTISKMTASLDGRPFGVQIFGREPELMQRAAEMAVDVGARLVDINMGCPAKRVVAGACGSALMKEPEIAQDLLRAVKAAVPAEVPVTVKHRTGWDDRHKNAAEFACAMVEAGAQMITVHGRTRAQGFSGVCDLDAIRAVREQVPAHIPVVGNGDVVDLESYRRMRAHTGCDGVMVGRGAMGNPFLFSAIRALESGQQEKEITLDERIRAFERHAELVFAHSVEKKRHHELRKVCAWYSHGLPGRARFRKLAWTLIDCDEILAAARNFFVRARSQLDISLAKARNGQIDFRVAT